MHIPSHRARFVALVVATVLGLGFVAVDASRSDDGGAAAPVRDGTTDESLAGIDVAGVAGLTPVQAEPTHRVPRPLPTAQQLAGPDPDARAYAHPHGRTGSGRPNVVLVLTDDMTASDLRYMPITRRLIGDRGATFDRALSPHPLCCPARAAILTGQYAQNNGVKGNQQPYDYVALHAGTALPVWLHRAGYQTGFTGKYLNGFNATSPRQPGWDYWDPTLINEYAYTPFAMAQNTDRPHWYRHVNNVDYINARTVNLVNRFAAGRKPFFIWASQVAPHGRLDPVDHIPSTAEAYPPRRFLKDFRHAQSPSLRDPAFDEADVTDKNDLVSGLRPVTRTKINTIFRSRIRALQGVDEGVRELVGALQANHVLRNTIIVFTSDNGFLLGEHRLVTKNLPYTQAIRVPMLVRGPGIKPGQHLDQRALMIDLAPTIADAANAAPLVKQDGVSLLPTLRRGAPLRQTVLIQAGPAKQASYAQGWWWRGVTTNRYTYADFFAEGREELYDHQYDPAETHNLASNPAYAAVLAELRRRTVVLGPCAGSHTCSSTFPALPEPTAPPVIVDPDKAGPPTGPGVLGITGW